MNNRSAEAVDEPEERPSKTSAGTGRPSMSAPEDLLDTLEVIETCETGRADHEAELSASTSDRLEWSKESERRVRSDAEKRMGRLL